jgi:WD40 repeat protein
MEKGFSYDLHSGRKLLFELFLKLYHRRQRNVINKTFRVFVSSTFSDLTAERNALQRNVFPLLQSLASSYGARFVPIDLRWGISSEADLAQRTMQICLSELEHCQETTPRPNFIVLLGDRYGWQPLPEKIPQDEFALIEKTITEDSKKFDAFTLPESGFDALKLLQNWYHCDLNNTPPLYVLQPKDPQGRFADYEIWNREVERPLHKVFSECITRLSFNAQQSLKYEASATHQEIEAGAMRAVAPEQHIFGFFRNIKNLDVLSKQLPEKPARLFVDLDDKGKFNHQAYKNLGHIKQKLRDLLKDNIFEYEAQWNNESVSTDHIGSLPDDLEKALHILADEYRPQNLCEGVFRGLGRVIEQESQEFKAVDKMNFELNEHKLFRKRCTEVFYGQNTLLTHIRHYLNGNDTSPLMISGGSGTGKTSLLAQAASNHLKEHNEEFGNLLFERYVGATPNSSSLSYLIDSLCHEIADFLNAKYHTPSQWHEIVKKFHDLLDQFAKKEEFRMAIILNALDQIEEGEMDVGIGWLPFDLPKNIKLVLSVSPENNGWYSKLVKRLLPDKCLEMPPLTRKEGKDALLRWLEISERTLQNHQLKLVLDQFEQNGMPLYLRMAFHEVKRWRWYETAIEKNTLPGDVMGIIEALISRLSQREEHGPFLVSRALGYLASSRNGLAEDEMIDLLSLDDDVFEEFESGAYHELPSRKLPYIVWSRLFYDLKDYLAERSADGTILLSFSHRMLQRFVRSQIDRSGPDYRKSLSEHMESYFSSQKGGFWHSIKDRKVANTRVVSELPFHQLAAEQWQDLFSTLSDLDFLEVKCASDKIDELLTDLRETRKAFNGLIKKDEAFEDLRDKIDELQRFISSSSHQFKALPDQVFQNAMNMPKSSFIHDLAHAQWQLRKKRRNWLDKGEDVQPSSCIAVLSCPDSILSMDISPDDKSLAAGLKDGSLILFNLETYRKIDLHRVSKTDLQALRFVNNGDWVVVGDLEGNLSCNTIEGEPIWSLELAAGINYIELVSEKLLAVAVGGFDQEASGAVWLIDWERGKSVRSRSAHYDAAMTLLYCPTRSTKKKETDKDILISGGMDANCCVWSIPELELLYTFDQHTNVVFSLALDSSNPDHIVSAARNMDAATTEVFEWNRKDGEMISRVLEDTVEKGLFYIKSQAQVRNERGRAFFIKIATSEIESGKKDLSQKFTLVSHGNKGDLGELMLSPGGGKWVNLKGHVDRVYAMTFFHNHKMAASGSFDNTVRIWELSEELLDYSPMGPQTGERRKTDNPAQPKANGHQGPIHQLLFHKDLLLSCCSRHEQQTHSHWSIPEGAVWDMEKRKLKHFVETSQGSANQVFESNGRLLLLANLTNGNALFDIEQGREVKFLGGSIWTFVEPYGRFSVSSRGRKTGYRSWEELVIRDINSGSVLRRIKHENIGFTDCVFSHDSRFVAVTSHSDPIMLCDLVTGEVRECRWGSDKIPFDKAMAFSTDGKFLLAADSVEAVLFSVPSGERLRALNSSQGGTVITFLPFSNLCAIGCESELGRRVDILDINTDTRIGSLVYEEKVTAIAAQENQIAVGFEDSRIDLFRLHGVLPETVEAPTPVDLDSIKQIDVQTKPVKKNVESTVSSTPEKDTAPQVIMKLADGNSPQGIEHFSILGHTDHIYCCALSHDGSRLFSSTDGKIKVTNVTDGRIELDLEGHFNWIDNLKLTDKEQQLLSVSKHRSRRWNLSNGKCISNFAARGMYGQITFSLDGALAAVFGSGIELWDTKKGLFIKQLKAEESEGLEEDCAFFPNGKQLVSAEGTWNKPGWLSIWDIESGKPLRILQGHTQKVLCCDVSPCGRYIVSGSADGNLYVWEVESGEIIASTRLCRPNEISNDRGVSKCEFSVTGESMAARTINDDHGCHLVSINNSFQAVHEGEADSWVYFPDGKYLVMAQDDCTLQLYNACTGEKIGPIGSHGNSIIDLAVSGDGRWLASASRDQIVKVWNMTEVQEGNFHFFQQSRPSTRDSEKEIGHKFENDWTHSIKAKRIVTFGDASYSHSAGRMGSMTFWDAGCKQLQAVQRKANPRAAAFSCDGRRLLSVWESRLPKDEASYYGECDYVVHINEAVSLTSEAEIKLAESAFCIALDPNRPNLAALGGKKSLKIITFPILKESISAEIDEAICSAAFSPDSEWVLTGSGERDRQGGSKEIILWDTQNLKRISSIKADHYSAVNQVFISPDKARALTGSKENTVFLWELPTLELVAELDAWTDCCFSPDGMQILSSSPENHLKIFSAQDGGLLRLLEGHADKITACEYSPDGRMIMSVSKDTTVRLWDAQSGKQLGKFDTDLPVIFAIWMSNTRIVVGYKGFSLFSIEVKENTSS